MQMDRDWAANLQPSLLAANPQRAAQAVTCDILSAPLDKSRNQDQGKGAVEQDQKNQGGNTNMNGQLAAATRMLS